MFALLTDGAWPAPAGALPAGSVPCDEAVEGFWVRHLWAGVLLWVGASCLSATYLLLSPQSANHDLEWLMVGVSVVASAVVVALPRSTIIRSPRRMAFFVTWSALSCIFASTVAALDGGLASPGALFVFLPISYAALAYPPNAVLGIGAVGGGSAVAAALAAGDTLARTQVHVGTIAMVTLLAASVTRARAAHLAARQELTARLVELANHDGLTGCLNHRAFYAAVEAELARAARHGHDVSLLVVDIDDFKSINDTRGHLVGDAVLRAVGGALFAAARSTDAVGRLGGDEFAVLLPETDRAQAEAASDRFAEALAGLDDPVPVAATIGVAHLERPAAESRAQVLVAAADARLYELKQRPAGDGRRPQPER